MDVKSIVIGRTAKFNAAHGARLTTWLYVNEQRLSYYLMYSAVQSQNAVSAYL